MSSLIVEQFKKALETIENSRVNKAYPVTPCVHSEGVGMKPSELSQLPGVLASNSDAALNAPPILTQTAENIQVNPPAPYMPPCAPSTQLSQFTFWSPWVLLCVLVVCFGLFLKRNSIIALFRGESDELDPKSYTSRFGSHPEADDDVIDQPECTLQQLLQMKAGNKTQKPQERSAQMITPSTAATVVDKESELNPEIQNDVFEDDDPEFVPI